MSEVNVREQMAQRMNDMTVTKDVRDHIRKLFELPPAEGFLMQMKQDISGAVHQDKTAVDMFLLGVKRLIENKDARILDQSSNSEVFRDLITSALMMSTFYQTIPPNELFLGVYHHYNLSNVPA